MRSAMISDRQRHLQIMSFVGSKDCAADDGKSAFESGGQKRQGQAAMSNGKVVSCLLLWTVMVWERSACEGV